jgi:hypothetical protein
MALTVFEEGRAPLDPQKALYVPLGVASPLWLLFGGAASAGLAYWWMTRWADRTHLEAVLAAPATAPLPEITVEPAAQAVEEAAETTAAVAKQISEAVVESVVEAADVAPVVVEAAAETAVEADPAPKTRTRVRPSEPPSA